MADAWSEFMEVEDGVIPEELLPARAFQWRWEINHDVDLSGTGTRTVRMEWDVRIGEHRFSDVAPFTVWGQADPLGGGITWTYYMENGATVRTEGDAEQGGDEKGDLVFDTDLSGTEGMGEVANLWGHIVADQWDGLLAEGAAVEVLEWYPQSGIPGGYSLWIATLKGDAEEMPTVLDPVNHNTHEFWVKDKALITRRKLRRGGYDGVQIGCTVTRTTGGVNIAAGTINLQGQLRVYDGGEAASELTTGYVVVYLDGEELKASVVAVGDARPQPHTCVAKLDRGIVRATEEYRGTIITDGASSVAAWIEDDGTLMVDVDAVDKRRTYRSRDRGAVWVRKLG